MKNKKYLELLKRSIDRGKKLPKQENEPSYIQEDTKDIKQTKETKKE